MPKPAPQKKTVPQKRKLPAHILAVYAIALVIANFYKPQWFLNLDWWVYLPLLPLEIWFISAYKKED